MTECKERFLMTVLSSQGTRAIKPATVIPSKYYSRILATSEARCFYDWGRREGGGVV
jgi:hypothetical protein